MAKKINKKELGLGIRALLGNIEEEYKENASGVVKNLNSGVLEIPLDQIETNPFQPRSEFEQNSIQELATSIKTYGLIQPITVRRLNSEKYQLISGERRYRASQLAGLVEIPAYIRLADDQQMLEMALVENIQRKDLNAIEVAISYQRLIDECQLTHEALSERIGKDRTTVTNYTRLLKLPPEIQQSIKANSISIGHAKALAGIQDIALQLALLRKTIDEELSVRALEQMIRSYNLSKNKPAASEKRKSNKFKQIAFQLSDKLETDVQIKANAETDKGTIIIHFNGIDEFNRIFDQLDL
jgi:ParB family transcriptional regulator, chromosome partitioning protein